MPMNTALNVEEAVEVTTNATNAALATPPWFAQLRATYGRGESFATILHGNTDDFVWLAWPVERWLAKQFAGVPATTNDDGTANPGRPGVDVNVSYTPARGLTFGSAEQKRKFDRTFGWPPPLTEEAQRDPDLAAANAPPEDMPLPDEPDKALLLALEFLKLARKLDEDNPLSEPFVSRRHPEGLPEGSLVYGTDTCRCGGPLRSHNIAYHDGARSAALIINHADLFVDDAPQNPDVTKHVLELLHDAAADDDLITAWNPIVLIARNLAKVNSYVRSAPGWKTVRVPLPDPERRKGVALDLLARDPDIKMDMTVDDLVALTAGLGARDLEDIVLRAEGATLTRQMALERQKELMDVKYGEVLVRLEPSLTFEDLGGMVEVKTYIDERMIDPILAGDIAGALRGMALCGPPGTGKSALCVASAGRARINAIEIRAAALKSKWHGESEQLMERLIEGAEMFAPTFVFIDEFEKAFGSSESASQENAPDQNQRKRMQEWMATAKGIIFMVATNYPGRVDPALFRTGRIDVKAPVLAPETAEERADILLRILKRPVYGLNWSTVTEAELLQFGALTPGRVGSDLEFIVKKARGTLRIKPTMTLTEALAQAVATIIPSDNAEIRAQTAAALAACNDTELLPARERERRAVQAKLELEGVEAPTPIEETPATRRRRPAGF